MEVLVIGLRFLTRSSRLLVRHSWKLVKLSNDDFWSVGSVELWRISNDLPGVYRVMFWTPLGKSWISSKYWETGA